MRIVAREIDKYKSTVHEDKYISEYIIYLMVENVPIEAHLMMGTKDRDKTVSQLNLLHNIDSITHEYLIS